MELIPVTLSGVHNPTVTAERMLTPEKLAETFAIGWQHVNTEVLKWQGGQRVLQHHYVKDGGRVQAKYITRHNILNVTRGEAAEMTGLIVAMVAIRLLKYRIGRRQARRSDTHLSS